ncbi:hypothetical protein Tco_1312944 [Tanacetum coccineum]
MRNKPDTDEVDINDLYNNLRVYEDELKSTCRGDFGIVLLVVLIPVPYIQCYDKYSFLLTNNQSSIENGGFSVDGWRWTLEELDLHDGRSQGEEPLGENGRSNSQTMNLHSGTGGLGWLGAMMEHDFEVEPSQLALMANLSSKLIKFFGVGWGSEVHKANEDHAVPLQSKGKTINYKG